MRKNDILTCKDTNFLWDLAAVRTESHWFSPICLYSSHLHLIFWASIVVFSIPLPFLRHVSSEGLNKGLFVQQWSMTLLRLPSSFSISYLLLHVYEVSCFTQTSRNNLYPPDIKVHRENGGKLRCVKVSPHWYFIHWNLSQQTVRVVSVVFLLMPGGKCFMRGRNTDVSRHLLYDILKLQEISGGIIRFTKQDWE